jgi:hypothetical protein
MALLFLYHNFQCLLYMLSCEWFLKTQGVQWIYEPCQKWRGFLLPIFIWDCVWDKQINKKRNPEQVPESLILFMG